MTIKIAADCRTIRKESHWQQQKAEGSKEDVERERQRETMNTMVDPI